ncbi:MAG: cytochrome c3 family protein, partial [bacterium]|nr:cytochrome c3 family protein [bacterium]
MITRHRTFLRSATLAAIFGGLVVAAFALSRSAPQTAAERRGLIFNHDQHAQQGFECLACHDAQKSATGRDDLLPGHGICNQCHEIEIENECATCHRNSEPQPSLRVKDYSPKF